MTTTHEMRSGPYMSYEVESQAWAVWFLESRKFMCQKDPRAQELRGPNAQWTRATNP